MIKDKGRYLGLKQGEGADSVSRKLPPLVSMLLKLFFVADLTQSSLMNLHNKLESSLLFGPFQPSLMFVSKSGTYPLEVPFICFSLEKALGLTHKLY